MSRLWDQPSACFYSDTQQGKVPQTLEVNIDFQDVDINDYDAVIMGANYTSVRLRYFEPPPGSPINAEQIRNSPAVQFYAKAMANPRIVKGALCHGLWILTPMPELLRDRQVICHEVVLADIVNAGATYVPSPSGVMVDGDLVTGRSKNEVEPFIDAIAEQILQIASGTKRFSTTTRTRSINPLPSLRSAS